MLPAIGTVATVGLASGLTLPLVSVRLAEAGAWAWWVAVMAALPALGGIVISPWVRPLVLRFGSKTLLAVSLGVSALSVSTLAMPYEVWLWVPSRFVLGVAVSVIFALGEARILEISADATRGRWMGLYATVLTGCQLAGPALLAALGVHALAPVALAVALHGVALWLLVRTPWPTAAADADSPLTFMMFLSSALPVALAVLFFSAFDNAVLSLLPLYGLKIGMVERLAILLATVVLLGDSLLQIPFGWAADRFGRTIIHGLCGGLVVLTALCVPWLDTAWRWPMLWLLGGAAGGIYTLGVVQLGDRFSGAQLIGANAYVGLLWGIGSMTGPLVASAFIARLGRAGLFVFVACGAALFSVTLLLRRRHRP